MSDIQPIDADLLETLRQIPSCSIANAIETFSVQPRNVGFMGPEIKSIFPNMGHMIGYAVTAKIAADAPPSAHMNVSRTEWVDEIMKVPGPRVLVLEDIDYPNPIGSFWGEVQAKPAQSAGRGRHGHERRRPRLGRDAGSGLLRLRVLRAWCPTPTFT